MRFQKNLKKKKSVHKSNTKRKKERKKERNGGYVGATVQVIPHIKNRVYRHLIFAKNPCSVLFHGNHASCMCTLLLSNGVAESDFAVGTVFSGITNDVSFMGTLDVSNAVRFVDTLTVTNDVSFMGTLDVSNAVRFVDTLTVTNDVSFMRISESLWSAEYHLGRHNSVWF